MSAGPGSAVALRFCVFRVELCWRRLGRGDVALSCFHGSVNVYFRDLGYLIIQSLGGLTCLSHYIVLLLYKGIKQCSVDSAWRLFCVSLNHSVCRAFKGGHQISSTRFVFSLPVSLSHICFLPSVLLNAFSEHLLEVNTVAFLELSYWNPQ